MARDEKEITIEDDNDDKGRTFWLRKMAAMDLFKWRQRAGMLVMRSADNLPPAMFYLDNLFNMAAYGIGPLVSGLGKLPAADVEALLDELMVATVVGYMKPGGASKITSWRLIEREIQDAGTFWKLQEEVLDLNVGFTVGGALSTFLAQFQKPAESEITPNIPTSTPSSPSS